MFGLIIELANFLQITTARKLSALLECRIYKQT